MATPIPVPSDLMGLANATTKAYDAPAGRLKVVARTANLGSVIVVAIHGTPAWVDGEEANGIVSSFLGQ